jgi:hypothetical protein
MARRGPRGRGVRSRKSGEKAKGDEHVDTPCPFGFARSQLEVANEGGIHLKADDQGEGCGYRDDQPRYA